MMTKSGFDKFALRMLMVLMMLTACLATTARNKKKRVAKAQPVPVAKVSDNDAKRYKYFYLEASRQQQMGNDAAAFDLLKHCTRINPQAPEANILLILWAVAKCRLLLAELDFI